MADSESTMDQTSPSASQEPPQPQTPVRGLSRRGTGSSAGADIYNDLPAGNWRFNLHGNCSICHHHHTAMTIKIQVTQNSGKFCDVQCENCSEKWLAIGRNNSTQISLQSTVTIIPDPVEREVRRALVSMIRSASTMTAIAAPTLAGIPESALPATQGESSTSSSTGSRRQPRNRPSGNQSRVSFNLPPSTLPVQTEVSYSSTQKRNPIVSGQDIPESQHPRSNFKQRVKGFLRLRKFGLRQLLNNSKPPKISDKRAGKQRVEILETEGHRTSKEPSSDYTNHEEQHLHQRPEPDHSLSPVAESPVTSEEAAKFLQSLIDERIEDVDVNQNAAWIRRTFTRFKTERAKPNTSRHSTTADTGTQSVPIPQEPGSLTSIQSFLLEFVGSRFSHGDRGSLSDHSIRARRFSISEPASDARTLVNDNPVAPNPLLSRVMPRDQGRSGSPRPSSLGSAIRNWQQRRQYRDSARYSIGSNTTGGVAGGTSTARDPTVHRFSLGRASNYGLTELFRSQTSLHQHVNAEESVNDEHNPSPPPHPPSPMPQSPSHSSS